MGRLSDAVSVAIGVGVTVPKLNFKKNAELVEKPGFEAKLKYETGTTNNCTGIDWNIQCEYLPFDS